MAQLMPLPLTVSSFSKIQIGFTFLVPAHPGSPGKRAVKHVCVCVLMLLAGSVAGHQLQQNQLVLSLNQSYYQLVTNQNALIDRFNRLEQLVLGTTPPSMNVTANSYGPTAGPLGDDVADSVPNYSLFTGAQSPFNLNNCKWALSIN